MVIKKHHIKDFGAVGDGCTNDANAFARASAFLNDGNENIQKILVLDDVTYKIGKISEEGVSHAISLCSAKNVSIEGNGAKIAIEMPTGGAKVLDCENITMRGLEIYFDPSPMVIGKVVAHDEGWSWIDVKVADGERCGISESGEYVPAKNSAFFASANGSERDLNCRDDYFIEKMEFVAENVIRIHINVSMMAGDLASHFTGLVYVGSEMVLPRVGYAHCVAGGSIPAISVTRTDGFYMYDSHLHDIPLFCVGLASNGEVKFDNVKLMHKEGSGNYLVSWRDGYHCKNQYKSATWENCECGMLGDDIYNIATTFFDVKEVVSNNTFKVYPHEGEIIQRFVPGDTVGFLDLHKGFSYGSSKIKSVTYGETRRDCVTIETEDSISGVKVGSAMEITYTADNPDGHYIRNCKLYGSIRVKAPTVFENCDLPLTILYINNESWIEGPIPQNIKVKNCYVHSTSAEDKLMIYVNVNGMSSTGYTYRAKDISIEDSTIIGTVHLNKNDVKIKNCTFPTALGEDSIIR